MFLKNASILTMVMLLELNLAHAGSIGVNFTGTSFGGGPYPILPTEFAGLVKQMNWNNANPVTNGSTTDINGPVAGNIVDNLGHLTGVNVQWFNANSNVNSSGGTTTPDERLYRGFIEGSFFKEPSPQLEVTISNIPYAHYDVIAYLVGFSFDATSSVRLGSTEYYFVQSSNFTTDGFIKATATSLSTATLATYAEFDNLSSSSITLEMIKQLGNRPGIAGFQIIQVPEASSFALLGMTSIGLIGLGVRNRFVRQN